MIEHLNKYFDRSLFQLIYHVTFKCNAKCGTCFNWHALNKEIEQELKLEEVEKFSKSMPNFPWMMVSGGEPFLRTDLSKVIQTFYKNNKIRHFTAPTNGLLPEQVKKHATEILENCKKLSMTLSFSLDDLYERHDKIRGVKGNFEKLLFTYNQMKELKQSYPNLAIKFNTVISSWNYMYADDIVNFVKGLNADMHTLDFIRGSPKDLSMMLPPRAEVARLQRKIIELYDYYDGYQNMNSHAGFMAKLSKKVMQHYQEVFGEVLDKQDQVIPCLAGTTNLVLYARGDVSSCEMLAPYANIRDYNYDYKKIKESEAAIARHKSIVNKECNCYHPCYQYVNILLNPKELVKAVTTKPRLIEMTA